LKKTSILSYEKISKKLAFKEVKFDSLGISSILFWHFPRAGVFRLIYMGCLCLIDPHQKYFNESIGEMGCPLVLMLSETMVANKEQSKDI
jgi:hypothetical protein